MRVLMVNKYYHMVGGVERYVQELTQVLQQRGHDVVPFAMADPRNDPSPYAEHFVTPIDFFDSARRPAPWQVAERVIYSREAYHKMTQLIEATQPDIAHIHNISHYISPSILDALHEQGIPVAMTLHEYKLVCPVCTFWVNNAICERCRGGRYYHCAVQRCNHGSLGGSLLNAVEAYVHRLIRIYGKVGQFISPSRFLRQKHIEYGLSPERIQFIPNFLLLEDYQPRFRNDGYFAYAGRLTPFKGVGTLLEAIARLQPAQPLLIVGDGPSRDDLGVSAARLGLTNVRFLGHRSGDDLRALIAGAMFVVVPSEWYENCPYAVLEAFALGKPVVATAIGGIPELIEDGVTGVLVPPSDPDALAAALQQMCSIGAPLPDMGRAARQHVERSHGAEQHIAAISGVYDHLGAPAL
jgi:glycosyltransferase involved in cell wall biosynthesis